MIQICEKYEAVSNIKPAYKENNVAIVFETSELFVPYLDVALISLAEFIRPDFNYDIIILSNELTEHSEKALKAKFLEKANVSLRVYNPHSIAVPYLKKAKYQYLEINYYRLLLPWILTGYDKAINLGADIVVNRDIAELFNTNLKKGTFAAGALDLGYHGRLSIDISPDDLKLSDPYSYVNADVLLLNLKAIRENIDKDFLMSIWQKRQLLCSEQDVINMAFDGHVQSLDLRWNLFPERMMSEYHIECAPQESVKKWKESLSDPYIIHYAAVPKPWDCPTVGYGDIWWCYARKSSYYEEILRRMCITAVRNEGIVQNNVQIGLKGALINYVKKHCPTALRPLGRKVKRLLRW